MPDGPRALTTVAVGSCPVGSADGGAPPPYAFDGVADGHVATRWALDHFLNNVPVEQLMQTDFAWREGWEYRLG